MSPIFRSLALTKMAFYGDASVRGSPSYLNPSLTVGQTLYDLNSNPYLPPHKVREAHDSIIASGKDVNSPIKTALKAGIGAFAGNLIANKFLHSGPFMQRVLTTLGANYGINY